MKKTIILCVGAIFALTLQAQNVAGEQKDSTLEQLQERLANTEARLAETEARLAQIESMPEIKGALLTVPKHEISLSVGIPGAVIMGSPEYHDENIMHLMDFEHYSAVGKLTYFYNFNKHWAIGGSASYNRNADYCQEIKYESITDEDGESFLWGTYTGRDNDARFNIVTLMPEVRAFWFQRRHFGMYSRFGFGVQFIHMTQHFDGTYKHLYVAPMFELAPIGFDFGGKHLRGKFELGNSGQTFLANVGIGYRF
ncbi:MAG: hypothetical protein Q4D23_10450 [Bacteroidales bacterium]|nr:hypothetical protein [Bacteroidales bacterium]